MERSILFWIQAFSYQHIIEPKLYRCFDIQDNGIQSNDTQQNYTQNNGTHYNNIYHNNMITKY